MEKTFITFEEVMSEAPAGFQDMEHEAQAFWNNDSWSCESLEVWEFWERFEEAFAGVWNSELDFTEDLLESTGQIDEIPEHFRFYFDYKLFARDLFISDYWSATVPNYCVAVFRSY